MKRCIITLAFAALTLYSGISHSDELSFERNIAALAHYVCSSELKKGSEYDTTVVANGDIEFKLLGPKAADIGGIVIYKKNEWEQQQLVLTRDQATRDREYMNCVTSQTDYLRMTYVEKKVNPWYVAIAVVVLGVLVSSLGSDSGDSQDSVSIPLTVPVP